MAYEIRWSDEAAISLQSSLDYVESHFTTKEITRFINAVDSKIKLIEFNPFMYRRSSRFPGLHYTNILGKVLLVYRVMPKQKIVELIHFWDGRQNPEKFKI